MKDINIYNECARSFSTFIRTCRKSPHFCLFPHVFIFILTIHMISVLSIVMNASDIVIYNVQNSNQLESLILLNYIERYGNR